MNTTKYWICDKCGKNIESAEDGWLQWILYGSDGKDQQKSRRIEIVHKSASRDYGCTFRQSDIESGGIPQDGSLEDYLGIDGLNLLLELLSRDQLPIADVIEIIKRLQIPGYEIARHYANAANRVGAVELNMSDGFFSQEQIRDIIQYAKTAEKT